MPLPIEVYALIGDLQTAALVGRDGSIDWLCLPRFDSGACFAALLGEPKHGRWLIAPAPAIAGVRRRYRPGTLILETEFQTEAGTVRLIDFMPPRGSEPDLVRMVEGVSGRVPMRMELLLRFDYGSVVPWVRSELDVYGEIVDCAYQSRRAGIPHDDWGPHDTARRVPARHGSPCRGGHSCDREGARADAPGCRSSQRQNFGTLSLRACA